MNGVWHRSFSESGSHSTENMQLESLVFMVTDLDTRLWLLERKEEREMNKGQEKEQNKDRRRALAFVCCVFP